jgi:catechol 2,3-dioxygenase-like lactoylglutathione lyase family enzyme
MHRDPGFKTIAQIAIVCRDIEATSKRWAALLGVEVPKNFTTDPGLKRKMTYRGEPSDAQCKLAFFDTGTCVLELIQPLGPGSSWQDGLDETGEAVHHIAFKVKDLDGTLRTCEELGMPLVHKGRFGSDDGTFAYVDSKKQLGVTVELLHSDNDAKE